MFLTRECDYAIRVVRALADMEKKPMKIICEQEQIPRPFAYKILKKLKNNGIVHSLRGAEGGYQLKKNPNLITLFDVVNAMDERLFLSDCLEQGYVCSHNSNGNICRLHQELGRLQILLMDKFREKTINQFI